MRWRWRKSVGAWRQEEGADVKLLTDDELRPFLSTYLSEGWKQDGYRLHSVRFEPERISALCDMTSYLAGATGRFHLTVPIAFLCISQLAIIGVCLREGLAKKQSEVLLREISIKCRREINEDVNVPIDLKLRRGVTTSPVSFYYGDFSVGDGAFLGTGTFVMPQLAQCFEVSA